MNIVELCSVVFGCSGSGFVAIFGRQWFQGSFHNAWSASNIAIKERLPIALAVRLWTSFANSRLLFMRDNMNVVSVINSHTSKD